MKRNLFISLIFTLLFCANHFAQSIGFATPQNNGVYASTAYGSTASTIPVGLVYSYSLTWPQGSTIYYIKLIADGTTYMNVEGGHNDILSSYNLSAGTHNWTLELWETPFGGLTASKTASASITFYVKFTISASNNFSGGSIVLDGSTVAAGSSVQKFIGEIVSVGAISNQPDGNGYTRTWNTSGINNSNWLRNSQQIYGATSSALSYSVANNDNGTTLTADLKKIYNATTQSRAGSVNLGGSSQYQVVESNPLNLSVSSYFTSNEVNFTFQNWTWSGGSSNNSSTTVYPSNNTAYYANYSGTATSAYTMNVHFTSSNGQNISLGWTDHPDQNVTQYQVWRWRKDTGQQIALATLSRGTTGFTDGDFIQKSNNGTKNLFYAVIAYYSPSGTWGPQFYYNILGDFSPLIAAPGSELARQLKVNNEVPTNYSINNYPNPFNPTTTINYQLPENGFVTLKVYDLLGKEIALLVNENKQAGYHSATFDASRLTSGVYIYTIVVNNFIQSKKMMLLK